MNRRAVAVMRLNATGTILSSDLFHIAEASGGSLAHRPSFQVMRYLGHLFLT